MKCLAVLEGHAGQVSGALGLADDRILSWSGEKTLRLWDGKSGQCLAVLEGHFGWGRDALTLADERTRPLELDRLPDDEAVDFMRLHQPDRAFAAPEQEAAAREIVRELNGLSLPWNPPPSIWASATVG